MSAPILKRYVEANRTELSQSSGLGSWSGNGSESERNRADEHNSECGYHACVRDKLSYCRDEIGPEVSC